jgi:uncharacterized protein YodC (DUF2158 family)
MDNPFKVGDVVRLKGSIDDMHVIKVEGDMVTCSWRYKGKEQTAIYPFEALEKKPESKPIMYDRGPSPF